MIGRAHIAVMFACSCSNLEPAMSAPPTTLSTFTTLSGGQSQVIAPGEPLVTLGSNATWWENGSLVMAPLPTGVNGYGARRIPGGNTMRIGLGTLALATRTWTADPALQALAPKQPDRSNPVKQVAWFADTGHVALLLETRNTAGKRGQELVIAAKDGRVRGRHPVEAVLGLAAVSDRLIVAGSKLEVLDLDAKVVAEVAKDRTAQRVTEGSGMFAAVIAPRGVKLIRPSDGTVVATWDVPASDAVPIEHGVVAVDAGGDVIVGCRHGSSVRETARVASGVALPRIQRVGETIVLAGQDANPIHVATFTSPCRGD